MSITVTLDKPDCVDGQPFEVRGLGVLKNRVPMTLTEDQERSFASETRKLVSEALKDDESFSMSGTAVLGGNLVDVLGYDPADISDSVEAPVPQGDKSPATSMGETDADMAPEQVEETPKVTSLFESPTPKTPVETEGGGS